MLPLGYIDLAKQSPSCSEIRGSHINRTAYIWKVPTNFALAYRYLLEEVVRGTT